MEKNARAFGRRRTRYGRTTTRTRRRRRARFQWSSSSASTTEQLGHSIQSRLVGPLYLAYPVDHAVDRGWDPAYPFPAIAMTIRQLDRGLLLIQSRPANRPIEPYAVDRRLRSRRVRA